MKNEYIISRIKSAIFGNKVAIQENLYYDTYKSLGDFSPDDLVNKRALLGAGVVPPVFVTIPSGTAGATFAITAPDLLLLANLIFPFSMNVFVKSTPTGQISMTDNTQITKNAVQNTSDSSIASVTIYLDGSQLTNDIILKFF